ncbi:hypothetical protein ABW21_db0201601 [Orbilia brochopaga]|nr:hypothetical protein ABW21_db0201601 [Drechslerella brochopaga]
MEASNPELVLDTSDTSLQSDCESMETATQPVTPADSVIIDPAAPQIYVSQDGEEEHFVDASESVRRLSFSTEDSDTQCSNLPAPKFNTLRSRSSGHGDHGHGVMLRWMKSLRGKSKLPQIHYDVYRSQAARESVHGNLSIAPSAMTSATKLTGSTNFLQRMSTATASRMSLSFYGSVTGFSKRDAVETDPRADDNLEDDAMDDTLDTATIERAQQRWKILAEIVLSEEEYIMDLKTMIAAFTSLKDNATSTDSRIKRRIVDNMTDLLEYQENFLSELFTRLPASIALPTKCPGSNVADPDVPMSSYENLADPSLVKSLADVFESRMAFFFAHIEYGANYENLKELVNCSSSSLRSRSWESGFEMLANAISAECNKGNYMGKKAATLADLIIKPVHHVCRYPLLLNRLLEVTPTIDAPEANVSLQRIIKSIKDLGAELNTVQCNTSGSRDQLEKTWLLREMITLPKEIDCLSSRVLVDRRKSVLRHLGRVLLCGVLQVAYSTNDGHTARYTIGSLYRTHLLLARPTVDPATQKAVCSVMFMIPLSALKSDDIQDRSLPDAEFSWKINFRKAGRLYRIRISAKTAEDAEIWRSSLSNCIDRIATDPTSSTTHLSYLPADIRARDEDKASVVDLKRQSSQGQSQAGLARSKSQPLGIFSMGGKEETSGTTKLPLAQTASSKSLEKLLHKNAEIDKVLPDRKEEAVSRLWPEQRNTLENLYSHVISTDILSSPMPKKDPPRRLDTACGRSMSASYIEERGLMRKLSLSSIWQSRKRSYAPTNFEYSSPKGGRPSRLIIPRRSGSLKPKRSKSEHFGAETPDEDDKENWFSQSKLPARTRSLLQRFSPDKYTSQSAATSPTEPCTPSSTDSTMPVSPVTHTSSISEKASIQEEYSTVSHAPTTMQGRIKKSLRGRSTLKKLFS